jgi:transcriptional regulator of NAD metabolism
MELLRRKKEGTGVISVRLPGSIYTKLVEQRRRAKLLGFSFNQTLAEILSQGVKQIHQELIEAEREVQSAKRGKAESPVERMAG